MSLQTSLINLYLVSVSNDDLERARQLVSQFVRLVKVWGENSNVFAAVSALTNEVMYLCGLHFNLKIVCTRGRVLSFIGIFSSIMIKPNSLHLLPARFCRETVLGDI